MTTEILLLLLLLLAALILFALEWLPVDLVTLLLLVALVLLHILSPQEAFSGFASEIIVVLASIFVLSAALLKSGLLEQLVLVLESLGWARPGRATLALMVASATLSAFLNNTTTTAILLPAALGMCRRHHISPSKILIPLAFGSILGGTCTLIGTSTNVAASGFLAGRALPPLSMFEFLPLGTILVVVGILYMMVWGLRLLPDHPESDFMEEYDVRQYLTELVVPPQSRLLGQPVQGTPLAQLGLTVLEVIREGEKLLPEPEMALMDGDLLIVKGNKESLLQLRELGDIQIKADVKLGQEDLISDRIKIVEALIPPESELVGRTIKELDFRRRFGVTALAVYRRGHALPAKVATLPLRVGDVLLLQGRPAQFNTLRSTREFWVLEEMEHDPRRRKKGLYAAGLLSLAVALSSLQLVPVSIAFLTAAVAVILLGCLSGEEAYHHIEWRLLILIGGMTSLGLALEKTGTADFLAWVLLDATLPLGIPFLLFGLVLLTMLLTQPMSNAAAALVILPVALNAAEQLQLEPRSFAILVTISASLSFATPLEPSCILVFGPGRYRFRDFLKVGAPLSLLLAILLVFMVPLLWPLR